MTNRQPKGAGANTGRWRTVVALLTTSAVAALAGVLATSARAEGVTREKLVAQGWTCVPFLPANRHSCFNPGLGRPFPGNPDPRPSYSFIAFDLTSGEFIYTGAPDPPGPVQRTAVRAGRRALRLPCANRLLRMRARLDPAAKNAAPKKHVEQQSDRRIA
jgi:hypothetical protein